MFYAVNYVVSANPKNGVHVEDWHRNEVNVIDAMNRQTHLRDVSVTVANADIDAIVYLVELSLFDLARGASRMTELYDLTTPMTFFHDDQVHFHAISNKIGKNPGEAGKSE